MKIRSKTSIVTPGQFNQFNLSESYVSLLLGILVVIAVVGFLFVFVKNRKLDTINPVKPETISQEIEKSKQSQKQYTVLEGDTLWSIAEKTYNSGYVWTEIAKENKLEDPAILPVGTKLSLVKTSQILATSTPGSTVSPQVDRAITNNSYTVVEGDDLWDIAVRAYGDGYRWPEIARSNNLDNPDLIHPGNVFTIPR